MSIRSNPKCGPAGVGHLLIIWKITCLAFESIPHLRNGEWPFRRGALWLTFNRHIQARRARVVLKNIQCRIRHALLARTPERTAPWRGWINTRGPYVCTECVATTVLCLAPSTCSSYSFQHQNQPRKLCTTPGLAKLGS